MSRRYNIWNTMRQRCQNPNDAWWHYYGGKGITICDEWQIFENFEKWALTNGYADNLTIDRKDTSKGYSPNNCRWITNKEQQRNKSNNIVVGTTLKELCEQRGLNYGRVSKRISTYGYTLEEALNAPYQNRQIRR